MSVPFIYDVGVVIGRFQVPSLHPGHRFLLDKVVKDCRRVLVLLGSPAWQGGKEDPLDYATRFCMFQREYPDFVVGVITDCQDDESWSQKVDSAIQAAFPRCSPVLYGGRDSFIEHYEGKYPTNRIHEQQEYSGTEDRAIAAALPGSNEDFRTGVIYSSLNSADRMAPCVDGAVIRYHRGAYQVVLIKKPGEKLFRFPGGKLDPEDKSLEAAVNREIREETGLEVGKPTYVTSGNLPDWRAVRAGITIHSSLFALPYVFGAPQGGDDAASAEFVNLEAVNMEHMEHCHKILMAQLKSWFFTSEEGRRFHEQLIAPN